MRPCDLRGLGVLVTRPAQQAAGLIQAIRERGGRPHPFPTLELRPPGDPARARQALAGATRHDLLIFVSANAVQRAATLAGPGFPPAGAALAAVGRATARALAGLGRPADLVPARADSEGLLALPELQDMHGRSVLIVRGEGGRPLLGEVLCQRGARVAYAECYRRALPEADSGPLLETWERDIQVVTASSNQVLDNLARLLGEAGRPRLQETPLVSVSGRMARRARDLGIARLIAAAGPGDAQVVEALCRWRNPAP